MTATTSTSRKVLVPLATLLAAGAVAVGSGATWTSNSTSAVDVTAGSIIHTNSTDGAATLTITKMQPGEVATGAVTITNTGDLDADLTISQAALPAPTNGFFESAGGVSDLTILVTVPDDRLAVDEGTEPDVLHSGNFATWAASDPVITLKADDGATSSDDEVTVTYTVTLDADAANASQGANATATFAFETTVADGQTFDQIGWNLPLIP